MSATFFTWQQQEMEEQNCCISDHTFSLRLHFVSFLIGWICPSFFSHFHIRTLPPSFLSYVFTQFITYYRSSTFAAAPIYRHFQPAKTRAWLMIRHSKRRCFSSSSKNSPPSLNHLRRPISTSFIIIAEARREWPNTLQWLLPEEKKEVLQWWAGRGEGKFVTSLENSTARSVDSSMDLRNCR